MQCEVLGSGTWLAPRRLAKLLRAVPELVILLKARDLKDWMTLKRVYGPYTCWGYSKVGQKAPIIGFTGSLR